MKTMHFKNSLQSPTFLKQGQCQFCHKLGFLCVWICYLVLLSCVISPSSCTSMSWSNYWRCGIIPRIIYSAESSHLILLLQDYLGYSCSFYLCANIRNRSSYTTTTEHHKTNAHLKCFCVLIEMCQRHKSPRFFNVF